MPLGNDDRPILAIVAGPNGSGKSSAYDNLDLELNGRSIRIVNPDLLARRVRETESCSQDEANLRAVQRIRVWLDASVDVYQTIGVETVLSTSKYRDLVDEAQRRGFEIWLMFVVLDDPERNVERVRIRVERGGHSVEEAKIRARYWRSLEQMPWFLARADRAWMYDNSGAEPKLVGVKEGEIVQFDPGCPRNLRDAVEVSRGSFGSAVR